MGNDAHRQKRSDSWPPILRVRDYLRPFQGDPNSLFGKRSVAARLKVSEGEAEQVMRELEARGLIEPAEDKFGNGYSP